MNNDKEINDVCWGCGGSGYDSGAVEMLDSSEDFTEFVEVETVCPICQGSGFLNNEENLNDLSFNDFDRDDSLEDNMVCCGDDSLLVSSSHYQESNINNSLSGYILGCFIGCLVLIGIIMISCYLLIGLLKSLFS